MKWRFAGEVQENTLGIENEHGEVIAEVPFNEGCEEEAKKAVQLMIHAPELLDLMKQAADILESTGTHYNVYQRLRAAIARVQSQPKEEGRK